MQMEDKKEINLEEQRNIQMELLNEFKNLCDNNNLMYFLGGGTLLGAIRHKGYIPWDDDKDLMMPRRDYENLLKIFNQNCKDNHKLLTYINTKDYYYSFAKVVDTNTTLLEGNLRPIKNLGIYIDIFPIDFLPNDEKEIEKIFKKYSLLYKAISTYKYSDISKVTTNKIKLFAKEIVLCFLKIFNLVPKILKTLDQMAIKYQDTSKVACISGKYAEKEIMPRSFIENYELADFEGEKYKIPKGYDEYLTKHYGNYMELPPEEKRITEHNNLAYWR